MEHTKFPISYTYLVYFLGNRCSTLYIKDKEYEQFIKKFNKLNHKLDYNFSITYVDTSYLYVSNTDEFLHYMQLFLDLLNDDTLSEKIHIIKSMLYYATPKEYTKNSVISIERDNAWLDKK